MANYMESAFSRGERSVSPSDEGRREGRRGEVRKPTRHVHHRSRQWFSRKDSSSLRISSGSMCSSSSALPTSNSHRCVPGVALACRAPASESTSTPCPAVPLARAAPRCPAARAPWPPHNGRCRRQTCRRCRRPCPAPCRKSSGRTPRSTAGRRSGIGDFDGSKTGCASCSRYHRMSPPSPNPARS